MRFYDNTRLSDGRRCLRYYFFRHVKHWVPDRNPSAPLAFGSGWHAAMDTMWLMIANGADRRDVVEAAYKAFLQSWRDFGMPDEDLMDELDLKFFAPRLPSTAFEMLWGYYDQRHKFIRESELLEVERPFAVPLTPDDPTLFYIGRIDKIIRPKKNAIRGLDHKTTTATKKIGANTRIRPIFLESFSPDSQMDGYLFALNLLYDEPSDIFVDAALVHPTEHDEFTFVPVDRMPAMLDNWLWTTHWWIDTIERELQALTEAQPSDKYMQAFPQDTRSCFDFNTACPFLDLCKSRANPLTWTEVPPGYRREVWDPLEHAGNPKELL